MHVDEAIRSRRTLKAYTDDPVARELVSELLDLAVLAPNHHETEPWRFWVVGLDTLRALSDATGDRKLLRSHTAVVVGVKRDPDAQVAEEDYAAVACAIENFMLAARGRGLASFWRTPGVLSRPAVAKILKVPRKVRLIGVVHVGWPGEPFPPQPGRSAHAFTRWLD
jgi:nitroreductase